MVMRRTQERHETHVAILKKQISLPMNNISLLSSDSNINQFWHSALNDEFNIERIKAPTDFVAKKGSISLLIIDIQTIPTSTINFFLNRDNVKTLLIGNALSEDDQIKWIVDGASGYVENTTDSQLIIRIVKSILQNEIWLARQLIPRMVANLAQKNPVLFNEDNLSILSDLTGKEIEVIKFLYCGECNHAIAGKMNISIRTVKAHLAAIYHKLNVEDRFQLVIKLKDAHLDAFLPPS